MHEVQIKTRVVLGVTGGIAAYKAAELVRLFTKQGVSVQVVMTRAAQKFVTPLTFQAVSGKKVFTDTFRPEFADGMDHIRLVENADALVIAPASAGFIGKMAGGLANDLLSTLVLAYPGPVYVAPAMNVQMYRHPAVRQNLEILAKRGVHILGPGSGDMACGHVGPGRLLEPEELFETVRRDLAVRRAQGKLWAGKTVVISAGPTREPLDAVRFLSNPSSGKMGYALAQAAVAMGAQVILVTGPTALQVPQGVRAIAVETAEEMYRAVEAVADKADLLVMAAAVCDFAFANIQTQKMKKESFPKALPVKMNPDILKTVVARRQQTGRRQLIVGFSMETDDLLRRSQEKLQAKGCDLIIANSLHAEGSGFGKDTNQVTVISSEAAPETLPLLSKGELGVRLLRLFAEHFARLSTPQSARQEA